MPVNLTLNTVELELAGVANNLRLLPLISTSNVAVDAPIFNVPYSLETAAVPLWIARILVV